MLSSYIGKQSLTASPAFIGAVATLSHIRILCIEEGLFILIRTSCPYPLRSSSRVLRLANKRAGITIALVAWPEQTCMRPKMDLRRQRRSRRSQS